MSQPPLCTWSEPVLDEWIDYNGHLSEPYYVLVLGHATDEVMDTVGLGPAYRESTGASLYTVEAHVRYLDQVGPGEQLEARSWVIGATGKLLWIWHELWAGGTLRATEEILGAARRQRLRARSTPFPDDVAARISPRWSRPAPTRPGRSASADERLLLPGLGGARTGRRVDCGADRGARAGHRTPDCGCCRCGRRRSRWVPTTRTPSRVTARVRSARCGVEPFAIDAHCVSNERFAAFVEATGHVTDAERYGWSFVFEGFLPAHLRDADRAVEAPWWAAVAGADLARARGSRQRPGRPRRPPRRARLLERRARLLPVGRRAAADRGRVGVRRPRRSGAGPLRLGRRPAARRQARVQHLAGQLPDHEHPRRRLVRHRARRRLRAQRLRPVQRRRQRLGVDGRPPGRWARRSTPAPGSSAAAPTCATRRTATATGSPPAPSSTPDSSTGHQGFRVAL